MSPDNRSNRNSGRNRHAHEPRRRIAIQPLRPSPNIPQRSKRPQQCAQAGQRPVPPGHGSAQGRAPATEGGAPRIAFNEIRIGTDYPAPRGGSGPRACRAVPNGSLDCLYMICCVAPILVPPCVCRQGGKGQILCNTGCSGNEPERLGRSLVDLRELAFHGVDEWEHSGGARRKLGQTRFFEPGGKDLHIRPNRPFGAATERPIGDLQIFAQPSDDQWSTWPLLLGDHEIDQATHP